MRDGPAVAPDAEFRRNEEIRGKREWDDPIVAPDEESRRDDGIRGKRSVQNPEFRRNGPIKNITVGRLINIPIGARFPRP